ncbi:MAG: glycosyl transferase [Clostridiales bacterium]|mgnify:CR=1 FL=1|nr:glycosyl transferase [Clostridiales bacterium]
MKVLILSCDTGEGHNSAAIAICKYLKKAGVECKVLDALSLKSEKASKGAALAYLSVIRIPCLFGLIYKAGMLVSSSRFKSPVYYMNKSYSDKLYEYINDNGFDTVITTHLFPAEALTALKRAKRLSAYTIAVNTDYTCIPFWEETELDYYIIPHRDLIREFVRRGIPKEKLLPFGIPVKPEFYKRLPRQMARERFCRQYNVSLDCSKPWYMIMSGSMGYGKIKGLVRAAIRLHRSSVNIIVICGSNHRLQSKLKLVYKNNKNVAICGYCKDVPLIMDASDVLFTKPGGLSSTEAAIKSIPIIHMAPIPGCESKNAEFFKNRFMSYSSKYIRKQLKAAAKICSDDHYRSKIIQAQQENIARDTCDKIYMLLTELNGREGDGS